MGGMGRVGCAGRRRSTRCWCCMEGWRWQWWYRTGDHGKLLGASRCGCAHWWLSACAGELAGGGAAGGGRGGGGVVALVWCCWAGVAGCRVACPAAVQGQELVWRMRGAESARCVLRVVCCGSNAPVQQAGLMCGAWQSWHALLVPAGAGAGAQLGHAEAPAAYLPAQARQAILAGVSCCLATHMPCTSLVTSTCVACVRRVQHGVAVCALWWCGLWRQR